MIVKIGTKELRKILDKVEEPSSELMKYRWSSADVKHRVNLAYMSKAEVNEIYILVTELSKTDDHYKAVYRKMVPFMELTKGVDSSTVIKKLDQLPSAIQGYFSDSKHKWVFKQGRDGAVLPYFITDIKYTPRKKDSDGSIYPAYVSFKASGYKFGTHDQISISWKSENLPSSIPNLLASSGLYKETEEAVASYISEFKRYQDISSKVGTQMLAFGEATAAGRNSWGYSSYASIEMVRDGVPTKVVIDDSNEEDSSNRGRSSSLDHVNNTFWDDIEVRDYINELNGNQEFQDNPDEDEIQGKVNFVMLPIHPYVKVFDLDKHNWCSICTTNLEDYEWDNTLIDKLILPKDHMDLVSMLMNQTGAAVEDIVKGKMSGVIVLATGNPGLGKTLTAEVFSEAIQKPLYIVQCSQLGLDVGSIEDNLNVILKRASRWGAILLIDEADVYIRRRGEDIIQNAIVGVFLRLIEYYRGVLFMTSNRGEVIDDAILSRATAWIKYESPNRTLLKKIWAVLGGQYGANFTETQLNSLSKKYEGISGRSVRNLLKLSHLLVGGNGNLITEEVIEQVSSYQDLEINKES